MRAQQVKFIGELHKRYRLIVGVDMLRRKTERCPDNRHRLLAPSTEQVRKSEEIGTKLHLNWLIRRNNYNNTKQNSFIYP